jgi:hypothetical protein
MRHVAGLLVWGLAIAALAQMGCADVPAVDSKGLPLKKVVVYRNGIGYFERAGRVEADSVTFQVRKNEIGDFLATLAVLERGGSSVRSAAFPLAVEKDKVPPPAPPAPGASSPGAAAGRSPDLETVVMGLDGKEHDLQVGYISVTPIWRPSYRLVLDEHGATLQAWGIVQNLSGEDWSNVTLSLITEAPLAFDASLAMTVVPPRPRITDGGDVIAVVPHSETSFAQEAPPPPAPPAAEPMEMAEAAPMAAPAKPAPAPGGIGGGFAGKSRGARAKRSVGGEMDSDVPFAQMQASEPAYSGRAKNLSALAAIALQAGATRYDVAAPVTIPDKSATMVMLLDRPIPGEAISLFAPDGGVPESASHPFRVARFSNKTGGLLERGPLAIFQQGTGAGGDNFLGQGMTDALPDGATATVPFALERTMAIEQQREYREEGARIYKIEAGTLQIARDSVTLTKYKVRNGAPRVAKLLVKHARNGGARLVKPPDGTEDNTGTGSALVPLQIGANATETLTVDERQQTVRNVDWLDPLAEDAVRAYLAGANGKVDPDVAKALKAAWTIRKVLMDASDERRKLAMQESDLRRGTEETRNNLKALEKNTAAGDLRAKLTARLASDSAELDRVTKRIVEVDLVLNEQRVRLVDALRGLKLFLPDQPS